MWAKCRSRHANKRVTCHTHEWVMSRTWLSRVTRVNELFRLFLCLRVMYESRHVYERVMSHTYEWVMSHILVSQVTHMSESCHTYEWVMSLQGSKDAEDVSSCRSLSGKEQLIIGLLCGKWPLKVRHPMGLRHPVTWSIRVTHVNETSILRAMHASRRAYERVMPHRREWVVSRTWLRCVTHVNESCHAYNWVVSHIIAKER